MDHTPRLWHLRQQVDARVREQLAKARGRPKINAPESEGFGYQWPPLVYVPAKPSTKPSLDQYDSQ